jgi:Protein of unknown function (DUF3147)
VGIKFDLSALTRTRWHEYALRFFFGGVVTVATGLIAKHYGPVFGGLFLAFPAIFPASATLVEKHETEKKQQAGIGDNARGRKAAALEARGAAVGSLGLVVFGLLMWQLLGYWNSVSALMTALVVWFVLAVLVWRVSRIHFAK